MNVDIEQEASLVAYLQRGRWIESGECVRVRVLHGGVSNKTVLVERDGQGWVLKQALAKLRVPVDWFSDPMRIHREASALRWLERLLPDGAAPRLVFEDAVDHVLCMEAVPEPHENWKEKLLAGRVDHVEVTQFATLLGEIHRRSAERLDELRPEFGGREFFESLRVEPYYLYAAESEPDAAPFLRRLVDETRKVAVTLTHGDFSPKNVLIHDGRLKLLDFEVAHIGDPAFDIGFSLAHLLSKAHHLPARRTELLASVTVYWDAYCDTVGEAAFFDGLEERAVRHACGCLLARVRGRSQLEYLSDAEKDRQAGAVLAILPGPPTLRELRDGFADALAG
jgi:5-methylthioribose kinase